MTLASGATLANTAGGTGFVPSASAIVYGDVTATGTGATVSGGFKFEGGTIDFGTVAADTRDLSTVLAFTNLAHGYLNGDLKVRLARGFAVFVR